MTRKLYHCDCVTLPRLIHPYKVQLKQHFVGYMCMLIIERCHVLQQKTFYFPVRHLFQAILSFVLFCFCLNSHESVLRI